MNRAPSFPHSRLDHLTMENYHRRPKTAKSKFEDDHATDPAGAKTTASTAPGINSINPQNRPQQHGVMVISAHGKTRSYITRALEVLTESDVPVESSEKSTSGSLPSTSKSTTTPSPLSLGAAPRGVLTIKAQGRCIAKAVTVAEILKRRMEGSLHQFTEIGQVSEQEIWDPNPDQPNLDPLTVTRHRPTIRIRLSKELNETPTTNSLGAGLPGLQNIPGASISRDEHADPEDENDDDDQNDPLGGKLESWPGAILDRDALARRFVGYQPPTGNDIYL